MAAFIARQPAGAIGVDVGCGNGKYLALRPDLWLLGWDRSAALVGLAGERVVAARAGADDVVVADALDGPFRGARADFALSIAVVHHLSTRERRQNAVAAVLQCLRPAPTGAAGGGQALIYVWALEQRTSRRGWDKGGEQDLLVPWVVTAQQKSNGDGPKQQKQTTMQKKEKKKKQQQQQLGQEPKSKQDAQTSQDNKDTDRPQELEQELEPANAEDTAQSELSEVKETSLGKDPHDMSQLAELVGNDSRAVEPRDSRETYHRYYHLYKEGELEEDIIAAGGFVVESGYERDNWWVICGRTLDKT